MSDSSETTAPYEEGQETLDRRISGDGDDRESTGSRGRPTKGKDVDVHAHAHALAPSLALQPSQYNHVPKVATHLIEPAASAATGLSPQLSYTALSPPVSSTTSPSAPPRDSRGSSPASPASTSSNSSPSSPSTPLQVLLRRRLRAQQLQHDSSSLLKAGDKVFAVSGSWLHRFFTTSFEESDLDIDSQIGQLSSADILDDTGLVLTSQFEFVSPQLFNKLCQWYGWKEGDPLVERSVYYSSSKQQLDVEAWPLYVIPHTLSSSAASVNRFRTADAKPFLISSHSTTRQLKRSIENLFGIPSHSKCRLWQVNIGPDSFSFPSVVIPSFVESITERKLIPTGKKHGFQTLEQRHVRSGHILLEFRQPDGTYLMDTACGIIMNDGLVGLNNLGNTCYMNSALQCLVHISELTYYFLYDYYKGEINKGNPLGKQGKIAETFGSLIKHLFDRRFIDHQSSFAPRDFRYTIGYFNTIFSDYRQQDSQEFIAFLLDGLHEDLNRVLQKPYVEKPELPEGKVEDEVEIRKLADQCWDAHKKRNNSIVIDLFVGQYKSTLICPECNHVSITFDPYNDLTLPLPIARKWHHRVKILPHEGEPQSFEVELLRSSNFYDLKEYVSKAMNVPMNELICLEVFQSQVYKNYEDKDSDTRYMPISDLISKGDDIWFYQVPHDAGDLVVPVFSTVGGGLSSKAFGIPFFITLSEEEQSSYGSIREKLEMKFTQLSTYHYFEKVRSQSKAEYTIEDFPKLDEDMKKRLTEIQHNDDELASLISLANPELPGDYAFQVKLLSGRKVRTRRSFASRFGHHVGYHSFAFGRSLQADEVSEDGEEDDNLWIPETNGDFGGLQDLLGKLDPLKRALYTYHAIDDEASETKLASPDLVSPDLASSKSPISESPVSNSPASSEDAVAPLSGPLVGERTALVCEWDAELFDVFFTGLEDEEDGGRETWTHPSILHNEDLENSRKEAAARRKKTIGLDDCLELFSKPEILGEQDLWFCPYCKEHRQATKKIEIWSVPDILTIHLKRFESSRSFSDKIDALVEFPIEGLDLSPYATDTANKKDLIYDLCGVDNHFGGTGGGHYTAFVKNFVDGKWYYYDDARVTPANPEDSIRGSAYLLFYRRRTGGEPVGGEYFKKMEEEIKLKREEREGKIKEMERAECGEEEEEEEEEDEDCEDEKSPEENGCDLSPSISATDDSTVKRRKMVSGLIGSTMMGLSNSEMNLEFPISDREEVMSTVSSSANAPNECD
ncbi:DEKNAAC103988 [Brettanomyces naardenensis]|uniref:ubiquitinyl hydrolase 1 n=1 Tax=Brettanomyces naardenensis TaxID=13370 RepID=A0A448YPW3_BRENA|nr:DEKNAAC103988 [Brettanomyces naardenensis]